MSCFRLRPRFTQALEWSVEETRRRISEQVRQSGARCEVKSFPGYLNLRIPEEDQHYWSPQLQLSLDAEDDGKTRITGIYGPNTNMWATFLYGYLIVGSAGLFSGLLGACQWWIGETAWGLWVFGVMLALALGLYLLAQFGQKLGARQTFLLHQVYQAAVGREAEIE